MAEALILEFDGAGLADYAAVNERLGIEMASGAGEWPDGLLLHSGAAKSGGLVVFEVWESRAAQEQFMAGRLGRALQEAGVAGPPSRAEWLELGAYHTRPG